MNKSSHSAFTSVKKTGHFEQKSPMHYQMRDAVILPIIQELERCDLQVTSAKKHNGSVFIFTEKDGGGQTIRTEHLKLSISNDGALLLQRFIPAQHKRTPVETISVCPHRDSEKTFKSFFNTFRNSLQRFNQSKINVLMTHVVFHHQPINICRKIMKKSLSRKPQPS